MADDNTIIEGTVKFRDGKKWKSRWCVMRKLSPVADCVHLQLYRDSKARWGGAASKASLSLQHYLGSEAGFTLDKHSNTLALVCRDFVAILAFETRERLLQWQVKVSAHLGEARHYVVLVAGGADRSARLAPGPARLLVRAHRLTLTAGVPPRLLGVWELPHLRRFGVVEGRFCFEGGSHCGKGEGLHVLITDQAQEIMRDVDLASQGRLSPKKRHKKFQRNEGTDSPNKAYRPDTRLSELNTIDQSLPTFRHYDEPIGAGETGAISPYWPSQERGQFQDMGLGDTASVHEGDVGAGTSWGTGMSNVTLERCMSCISKLGAMSRSSTAALTPGAKHFSPTWTMEPVHETVHGPTIHSASVTNTTDKTELCRCPEWPDRPPERPPKPTKLDLNSINRPRSCNCTQSASADENTSRVGPYENYDVPKLPSAEVEGEYYDTPKRLKECLNNELFKITKNTTSSSVILKKPCGCLLKLGKGRREPTIIDSEENFQPPNCPCQRVTEWANNWIKLPYCNKYTVSSDHLLPNKENVTPSFSNDRSALYATIDLSRKTRRQSRTYEQNDAVIDCDVTNTSNVRTLEIDDGPLANYENLSFALSLEHYENAKDLLRKAGVTQAELNAIGEHLKPVSLTSTNCNNVCTKCGHLQKCDANSESLEKGTSDDYLMMKPNVIETKPLPSGYTPMSPVSGFAFHTLKLIPKGTLNKLLDEKSASNPTLSSPDDSRKIDTHVSGQDTSGALNERFQIMEYRKRSSSADSSRFLEDVKEFEDSIGSHGSTSSIETLRNITLINCTPASCGCEIDNKHSDADSSETSKRGRGRGVPPAKRSASVPGKAGGNRDSSSSNDSGVSTCSLRRVGELLDFELPLTTSATRRHYRSARRAASCVHTSLLRRSKSTDPLRDFVTLQRSRVPAKSSSAEAEVPILPAKTLRSVADTHSTSSGTSDTSDYIETLSICSSHSSTDTPVTMRVVRQSASTLRPRSGKEYLRRALRPQAPTAPQ